MLMNLIKSLAMISRITNHESRITNRGFSLIEVLLAIVIVSGGVIAVAKGFASGLLAYNDTQDTELALNIAQAKMEEIKIPPLPLSWIADRQMIRISLISG